MSRRARTLCMSVLSVLLPASLSFAQDDSPESMPSVSSLPEHAGFLAHLVGLSVLDTVEERISGDHSPVASRPPAPASLMLSLSSWSSAPERLPVLGVHQESSHDRAGRERARKPKRPKGFGTPTPSAPVERDDWSLWLTIDSVSAQGTDEGVSSEASAQSVHFGIETQIDKPGFVSDRLSSLVSSGDWFMGIGASLTSGSADGVAPQSTSLRQSVPLLYPYMGYRDDRKRAYTFVGIGLGETDFSDMGSASDTVHDVQALVLGAGGSIVLGGRPDRLQLSLRGSAVTTGMSVDGAGEIDSANLLASTARVALDLHHSRELWGGRLRPFAGAGALASGGGGPSGNGYDMRGGARWDWRRLSASISMSQVFGTGDGLDSSTVVSGSLRYAPAPGSLGFFLAVAPVSPVESSVPGSDLQSASSLAVRAGYGFRTGAVSAPARLLGGWTPSSGERSGRPWLMLRYDHPSGPSIDVGRLAPSDLGGPQVDVGMRVGVAF